MQWFRSTHGAPTHRKWLTISRKSGQPVPVVVAVVWSLMDHASRNSERGSVTGFDADDLAAYLGIDDEAVADVLAALRQKGWLTDDERISSWEEHQVKKDDGAAARARAHRERQKQQTERNRTQPNAPDTDTELDTDTDNKRDSVSNETIVISPCENDPPECEAALDAYNEVAEQAGWPKAQKLTQQRRSSIRQRLRDAGGLEGWQDALAKAKAIPWLSGQNDRGWKANLDFFLQAKSFTKLMEGAYDGSRAEHYDIRADLGFHA